MNQPKQEKKLSGPEIFVSSMLESAQKNNEVRAQTRYDQVDEKALEGTMNALKKGEIRKR